MYAPPPNGIFDDRGQLFPAVAAARERGIWFDIGNGRTGHITWDMAERAIAARFLPDTISSDWTDAGREAHVVDFPNVLSKFLLLGMPLDQVIAERPPTPRVCSRRSRTSARSAPALRLT